MRVFVHFLGLLAVVVGKKHESVLVEALDENYAARRLSLSFLIIKQRLKEMNIRRFLSR